MPSRAGTHPTRLWGRYENGRRKYVSQKERQKNETGRKKIRRDAQGRVAALAAFEGLPVGVFRGRRHLPLGEGLRTLYAALGFTLTDAGTLTSATLIGLSAFTTAMGWYQKLAAKAGAGTLVPITGFANAVVSPAIEFRNEGLVSGVGAKMFIIAGPVIVYGMLASVVWGVIYHFIRPLMGG